MMQGHPDSPTRDGWRSEAVREALDLCLACKGCKSDCPADVDMATYKAEFLAHHYAGRLRPRADYATGYLPVAARLVTGLGLGPMVNRLSHTEPLHTLAMRAAGLEDREAPMFATPTLQQWWRSRAHDRGAARGEQHGARGTVLLWPDTFTNFFHPHIGRAAVQVLEDAGWQVTIPTRPMCCGLTWISTGQLAMAKRVLRRTVRQLAPHVQAGGYVVGLEPSCTAVFRSDAFELLPEDHDVRRLQAHTVTLAELLVDHTPGWHPPDLRSKHLSGIAQVHCHQHAVLGWDADAQLLDDLGVEVERLDSGCCGLAGNFGFTKGHGEVSEACAERVLLPRVREAPADQLVLADGFSCRTQIHDLPSNGREAVHLAELLAGGGRLGSGADDRPERRLAESSTARGAPGAASDPARNGAPMPRVRRLAAAAVSKFDRTKESK